MPPIVLKPKSIYVEEKTIGFSGSISYLVELIIQLSKYVTKGRGLSKNGVNALLLFLLTAGLLFTHTQFPTTLIDVLKVYSVPLVFLFFFIVDFAKNIDGINKFFRRLGQRTDFTYQNIMDGNINYEDLEYNLSNLNFSYKQITDIIIKLVDSDQFTPNGQNNLLLNNAIYRIDTLPLIKDSFIKPVIINVTQEQEPLEQGGKANIETTPIEIKWTPSAVCIFLSKMSRNLPEEYLDKLIEKYGEYPSVLIAIGYFYQYKKGEDRYFKIGREFKYTKFRTNFSMALLLLVAGILIMYILSIDGLPVNVKQSYNYYTIGLMALFVLSILTNVFVSNNDLVWSLKRHLKKSDVIKDDFVFSEIITNLVEVI